MSADLFDLGVRLRAVQTGRLQPRMQHTPVWPNGRLVAAVASKGKDGIRITAGRRGEAPVTAAGPEAVSAFGELGSVGSGYECLVVADRRQLGLLVEAAHASPAQNFDLNRIAGVVDWWGQRAEHPGTRAVIVVTDACRQRWATGEAPDAEALIPTWLKWLGLTATAGNPVTTLLDLAETVADGTPLGAFDPEADNYAWTRLRGSVNGDFARSWRYPDKPKDAALGCRARCDAQDHYARALLEDPAWAEREKHSGRVVEGRMFHAHDGLRVVTSQDACRFREGSTVCVSALGDPPLNLADKPPIAEVQCMTWDPSTGERVLELVWTHSTRRLPVGAGVAVRLTPEMRNLGLAAKGRKRLAERFGAPNWLTHPHAVAPPVIRRPVPLDVMVAAASFEP